MKTALKHLRDFLIPNFVTIHLPLTIIQIEQNWFGRPLLAPSTLQIVAGALVGLAGLVFLLFSIILMIRIA